MGRLGSEAIVGGGVAHFEGKVRSSEVRTVGVRLHLAKGDGRLGHLAVGVANAVPAVLPPLVGETPVGRPVVLHVAVPVRIPELIDPLDGPGGVG